MLTGDGEDLQDVDEQARGTKCTPLEVAQVHEVEQGTLCVFPEHWQQEHKHDEGNEEVG